jgi:hypothetical protein
MPGVVGHHFRKALHEGVSVSWQAVDEAEEGGMFAATVLYRYVATYAGRVCVKNSPQHVFELEFGFLGFHVLLLVRFCPDYWLYSTIRSCLNIPGENEKRPHEAA